MMQYIKTYEMIYHKELNPEFWIGFSFNERIRLKLLALANDFYDGFNYNTKIKDILLTGSMCNFNYNRLSDLDVHILIDMTEVNKDKALVKVAADGIRFIWNLRHNISIKGHNIELYLQDTNEKLISSGVYSLLKGEWIIRPEYNPPDVDDKLVDFKTKVYMAGIDQMVGIAKEDMTPEEARENYKMASRYKDKIKKVRKVVLEEKGEYALENLIFKNLRNSGHLEKLINVVNAFYDKIYSQ